MISSHALEHFFSNFLQLHPAIVPGHIPTGSLLYPLGQSASLI